jgi:hypothetical protein
LKQQLDQLYRPDVRTAANDELIAILVAVVKHFSKVYIFIDGLDECRKEERSTILSMINQLTHSDHSAVKILHEPGSHRYLNIFERTSSPPSFSRQEFI